MCGALEEAQGLGLTFKKPGGGIYLWCKLPERTDSHRFFGLLESKGVLVSPGYLFFRGGNAGGDYVRLNFSWPPEDDIDAGMTVFTDCLRASLLP